MPFAGPWHFARSTDARIRSPSLTLGRPAGEDKVIPYTRCRRDLLSCHRVNYRMTNDARDPSVAMPDRQPAGLDRLDNAPLAERARTATSRRSSTSASSSDSRPRTSSPRCSTSAGRRSAARSRASRSMASSVASAPSAPRSTVTSAPRRSALQRLVGFDVLLSEKGYAVRTEVDWERGHRPRTRSRCSASQPTATASSRASATSRASASRSGCATSCRGAR